jgi:hypothetical protein
MLSKNSTGFRYLTEVVLELLDTAFGVRALSLFGHCTNSPPLGSLSPHYLTYHSIQLSDAVVYLKTVVGTEHFIGNTVVVRFANL